MFISKAVSVILYLEKVGLYIKSRKIFLYDIFVSGFYHKVDQITNHFGFLFWIENKRDDLNNYLLLLDIIEEVFQEIDLDPK